MAADLLVSPTQLIAVVVISRSEKEYKQDCYQKHQVIIVETYLFEDSEEQSKAVQGESHN